MRQAILLLIARQFWISVFKSKAVYLLMLIIAVLLSYASYSGISYYQQNHFRTEHQKMARASWEANPDKHPHRMAHFGSFAFRLKHPLSMFDFGIESYTGNAVFLEAHKQNMVNFSDAGFSTGLLRFGELSMAMILQTILPLIIFFIGYAAIVADKENGTLKILITQGASWKEIILGRILGLLSIATVFLLPFVITAGVLLILDDHTDGDDWLRLLVISSTYIVFIAVLCVITILISVSSGSSKNALVKLLGLWLLMVVLMPRTAQALGAYFYDTPTKLEFRTAIEKEVISFGDSHDPNDPHFSALKDSVLQAHGVKDITQLPFNYGGFVMSQGEKISANIYTKHQNELLDQYRKQNQFTKWLALINPYLAVKNMSMSLSGTDFESYVDFQKQAEDYRYKMAQAMNGLQMKYISAKKVSGSEGKKHVVDRSKWQSFEDFNYQHATFAEALSNETISIISIIFWMSLAVLGIREWSKKAKAI